MIQRIATIAALLISALVCSSCREAIDDVSLERTTTVHKKWAELVPSATSTEAYTFVKFDLSAETNLVEVWDGLILQVECKLAGEDTDKDLDSVTFGPFYKGQNVGSMRVFEPAVHEVLPNESRRYEYVVYALPNFEVGKLVDHRRESRSVFETNFDSLFCYFRGVGKPSFSIPKSVVWSVSRDELFELSNED